MVANGVNRGKMMMQRENAADPAAALNTQMNFGRFKGVAWCCILISTPFKQAQG